MAETEAILLSRFVQAVTRRHLLRSSSDMPAWSTGRPCGC